MLLLALSTSRCLSCCNQLLLPLVCRERLLVPLLCQLLRLLRICLGLLQLLSVALLQLVQPQLVLCRDLPLLALELLPGLCQLELQQRGRDSASEKPSWLLLLLLMSAAAVAPSCRATYMLS